MELIALLDDNAHFRVIDFSTPEQKQKIQREILQSLVKRQHLTKQGLEVATKMLASEHIEETWFNEFLGTYTQIAFGRGQMEDTKLENSWDDRMTSGFY